ncbi:DUF697 domain-containing protein [Candidatus Halobeggiatoa sp. HSG11]|nr:DUF697 domain-containing protein [Candidatus Halobeggiatoa sp. HSG11]
MENDKLISSNETIKKYMIMSMGAGLIPIPAIDMVALTGIQLKMLSSLTEIYQIPFSKNDSKSIIGSLIGGVLPTYAAAGVTGSLVKMIPIGGTITGMMTMSSFGGASTYALGQVFVKHFESGGTLLDFDIDKMQEYFTTAFKYGKEQAQKTDEKDTQPA